MASFPSLDHAYFGNTIMTWVLAAGLATVSFAALLVLKRFIGMRLRRLAASTATGIDDLLLVILKHTRIFTLLAVALFLGSSLLAIPEASSRILSRLLVTLLFLQGALWGNAAIGAYRKIFATRRGDRDPGATTAVRAMTVVARVVLWGLVGLIVLDNLGVNITGLVAGLGIGGIAVALALQNILGDLFASLSILLDKPFVIGDFVVVDTFLGTVEHIGLKTTRLRSLSGEQIIISNADLLAKQIRNFKRMDERRVVLSIDITYETPYPKLARTATIIRECIAEQEGTRLDRVHFKEFGSSALRFEAVYFVLDPDYNRFMDAQEAINLRIFARFGREKLEFAYPTHSVFLRDGGLNGNLQGGSQEKSEQLPEIPAGARTPKNMRGKEA